MAMDELIGNLKTYEILKKLKNLKDEPKPTKNLVLKVSIYTEVLRMKKLLTLQSYA